ncbi:ERCC4 domain-containing protein [Caballeronia grimmiae]|uniref:ERCC4 domain-containing protein n=1 Tax=Caballeronia grimmiae TaxID=1071679 RepID=UPI0038BC9265
MEKKIIVDSRESHSVLSELLRQRGAVVQSEELECADFVLADGLAVARKTATDFIISLQDKRLFSQIAVCKRTYGKFIVLVEGHPYQTRSAMSDAAIAGALSYLVVAESVSVIQTENTAQTADVLLACQRQAIEGLGYAVALQGAKPKDRFPQAQLLVESLPGIGPSAAKRLLAHFYTARAVLNASPDELRKVPGISPKTAASIREVIEFDTRGPSAKVGV